MSTVGNYWAGLLRFTKFCNDSRIPELEQMPAFESLLSHFIALRGAASMSKSAMHSWLEGLWIWHQINEAPWNGSHALKRVIAGASIFSLTDSSQAMHEPVMIEHLRSLRHSLDLSDSFDIVVFAITCVAF